MGPKMQGREAGFKIPLRGGYFEARQAEVGVFLLTPPTYAVKNKIKIKSPTRVF